jgi:hypothetical protein
MIFFHRRHRPLLHHCRRLAPRRLLRTRPQLPALHSHHKQPADFFSGRRLRWSLSALSDARHVPRPPYVIDKTFTLESYDATDYGYLRVIVNSKTMTIEFHPQSDGGTTKTPNDVVTVNLATHTIA